jgi:hypothetical protein
MSRSSLPPLEDDFTRALLRSADADEPSNAAYGKAAAALGVGAALGIGASVPAPAAIAAGAAGLAGAARWSGSFVARLAALGVSGALLVGGGALLLHGRLAGGASAGSGQAQPLPEAKASFEARSALAGGVVPSVVPSVVPPREPAVVSLSVSPSGAHAVPRRFHHSNASARAASGSSLAEQVQSLDRARVALGSGSAALALHEIAHYRKLWPKGVFLTEASVLEIEALAARGDRSRAASLASAFVAAHPDSPQAARLRALVPPEKR